MYFMSIRGRFRKPSGNDEAAQAALARAVQHAAQQHTAEESASQVASQVPKEEHTTDVVAPLLRADQDQNAATEGKEAGKKDKHRKVLPILVGATAAMVIAAGIFLGVSGTGSKPGEQAVKQPAAIHKTVPRQGSVPTLPTKGKVQGHVNIPQKKSPTAPAETKVPAANNTRTTATAASLYVPLVVSYAYNVNFPFGFGILEYAFPLGSACAEHAATLPP